MNPTLANQMLFFITTLAAISTAAVADAQMYRIEPSNPPMTFEAVSIDDPSVRYPCRAIPPTFAVLMCTKEDGTIISSDNIDYSASQPESIPQHAPVGAGDDTDYPASTPPCRSTPSDFDGPGGILCPPVDDQNEDSTLSTTTSLSDSSTSETDATIDGGSPTKQPRLNILILIAIVLVVGIVVSTGAILLLFNRNRGKAGSSKSTTDNDDICTVADENEADNDVDRPQEDV